MYVDTSEHKIYHVECNIEKAWLVSDVIIDAGLGMGCRKISYTVTLGVDMTSRISTQLYY